jgi:hypothetical protein
VTIEGIITEIRIITASIKPTSREESLAVAKLEEAEMWLMKLLLKQNAATTTPITPKIDENSTKVAS